MKRAQFFFEGDAGGGAGGGEGAPAAVAAAPTTLLAGSSQHVPTVTDNNVAAPWSWAKEDGTLDPGWLGRLPGDMQNDPSLKVIGSVQDLAGAYKATKALVGKKLEMPGEGATPEQVAHWRKIVGAPDKPEGYLGDAKSLRPDSVPENLWDTASEGRFLAIAHKHNLPPAAVKEILGYYGENIAGALGASQEAGAASEEAERATLRSTWGGEYEGNLAMASRVAKTVGLDPATDPIFTTAAGVIAFAKMGKLLSEDKLVQGGSSGLDGSIAERVRDITDPKSQSALARDYRGEFGSERAQAAQKQLHELMAAKG